MSGGRTGRRLLSPAKPLCLPSGSAARLQEGAVGRGGSAPGGGGGLASATRVAGGVPVRLGPCHRAGGWPCSVLCTPTAASVPVCRWPHVSFPCEGTVLGFGATRMTPSELDRVCKEPVFQIRSRSQVPGC